MPWPSLHGSRAVAELKRPLEDAHAAVAPGGLHGSRAVAELNPFLYSPIPWKNSKSPRLKGRGRIEARCSRTCSVCCICSSPRLKGRGRIEASTRSTPPCRSPRWSPRLKGRGRIEAAAMPSAACRRRTWTSPRLKGRGRIEAFKGLTGSVAVGVVSTAQRPWPN